MSCFKQKILLNYDLTKNYNPLISRFTFGGPDFINQIRHEKLSINLGYSILYQLLNNSNVSLSYEAEIRKDYISQVLFLKLLTRHFN